MRISSKLCLGLAFILASCSVITPVDLRVPASEFSTWHVQHSLTPFYVAGVIRTINNDSVEQADFELYALSEDTLQFSLKAPLVGKKILEAYVEPDLIYLVDYNDKVWVKDKAISSLTEILLGISLNTAEVISVFTARLIGTAEGTRLPFDGGYYTVALNKNDLPEHLARHSKAETDYEVRYKSYLQLQLRGEEMLALPRQIELSSGNIRIIFGVKRLVIGQKPQTILPELPLPEGFTRARLAVE